MRLKRLDLRGFKTFASAAEFVFDADFTAVVGPNGSGKSNVADALRWVLGEQSLRHLRSKKTEDVIFTGSSTRPPLGMAQVALTLDNGSGRLPMPYQEVTLTRRAFRSGDNEYVLNGTKVRLRDLNDLLLRAGLGNGSYTIVGQGLVDQALSLRPEERREMFEEAADVKRYWVSIRETEERIAAAEANAQRVQDVLAEIEPRLRTLRRQAEQARQHETIQREQTAALAAAYLVERARVRAEATALESRLGELADTVAAARTALGEAEATEGALEARRARADQAVEAARGAAEAARRALEAARAAAVLTAEKRRAAEAALQQTRTEIGRLQEAARRAEEWQAEQTAHLGAHDAAAERATALLAEAEAAWRNQRAAAQAAHDALEGARAATAALAADLSAAQANAAQVEERLGERERELTRARQVAGAADAGSLAQLDARLVTLGAERAEIAARIEALDRDVQRDRVERGTLEETRAGLLDAATRLTRERDAAAGRLELLERAQETGAGLYPGVRAVLAAARPGGLAGIVGTVASLVQVPSEIETAVEVALGGHLQDVVVATWRDAEAAVERLKATRAGRATFLPLDTIRGSRLPPPAAGHGIVGVAAELVEVEPALRIVVDHLLARTLIVDSLTTARRALGQVGGAWQIVTLSGELVRSSGAITGGSRGAESQMLPRERELRELPRRVASLSQRLAATQAEAQAAAERGQALRAALTHAEAEWRAALARQQALSLELAEGTRVRDTLAETAATHAAAAEAAGEAVAELAARRTAGETGVAAAEARLAAAQAALGAARQAESEARSAERTAQHEVQRLQSQIAARQQQRAATAANLARAEREASSAGERLAAQSGQVTCLADELAAREAELQAAEAAVPEREQVLAGAEAALAPLRGEVDALGRERHGLRTRQSQLAARLREVAAAHAAAESALRFARGERDALEASLLADLPQLDGVEDPREPLQTLAGERPLPEEGRARRQLEAARARLRGLGAIDADVVREHAEVLQRRDFLAAQLEDLRRGSASLTSAMQELRQVGRRRFSEAFESIAEAFSRHFAALFGGGRAHLHLTDPADPSGTGIDITAQPPGKRAQPLSLLSGGERALTASALIFAMLTVNPIPFCVLDEVDAALDEANVRRFLDVLRSLSQQTQFILITHNRATMEAAGALYGVTMSRDGSSQVVSLRVDQLPSDGLARHGRLVAD